MRRDTFETLPYANFEPERYGVKLAPITQPVEDGDGIDLGDRSFRVLHFTGHSPGGIGLEDRTGLFFSGDQFYDGHLFPDRSDVDRPNLLAREARLKSFSHMAEPTRIAIQQSLDSGADRAIIAHVENLAHAAELASYAKYPPLGARSVGGVRTFDCGGLGGTKFYAGENRRVRCYPMVETVGALNDVEAILKLRTIDGIFPGPADLNMACGRKGVFGRDDTADRKTVAGTCMAVGKDFGMNLYSKADMKASREIGLTFAALTDDITAMIAGVGQVLGDAKKKGMTSAPRHPLGVIPTKGAMRPRAGTLHVQCLPFEAPALPWVGRGDTEKETRRWST